MQQASVNRPEAKAPIRVASIGEALFDRLPSGDALGGAPLNTAVHCKQLLGAMPGCVDIVSATGTDELGQQVREESAQHGLGTDHLQTNTKPTGTVNVTFNADNEPQYLIAEDVAWDHIESNPSLDNLAGSINAVCFGSLAQRGSTSRNTIQKFLGKATGAIRVYDVNLRPGLSVESLIKPSLRLATVAKFGEDELHAVTPILGLPLRNDLDDAARQISNAFELATLVITRGAEGTMIYTNGPKNEPSNLQRHEGEPSPYNPLPNADPVGAGDSVGAAVTVGLLLNQPLSAIATWANAVGAYVAERPGATPKMPDRLVAANFFA